MRLEAVKKANVTFLESVKPVVIVLNLHYQMMNLMKMKRSRRYCYFYC